MHIKIAKSIIDNIISHTINFTEKKDNSKITSHILLKADKTLIVKATDLEFGIKIEDDNGEILTPGKITVNGKKLHEIIKALKDDYIEIEDQKNNVIIKQGKSIYKLPTFDSNEFPEFPEYTKLPKINLNSIELIEGLKKVLPVIDNNNPKYELNGALIDIKSDVMSIVSTDTKRLAVINIPNENPKEFTLIIPKKAIAEIRKLFHNEIDIYYDNVNLIIKSNKIYFYTKLINGKFPDYNRIIPKELKHELVIEKNKFISALKQISIISTQVKFTVNEEMIEFESISEENLEAKTQMPLQSSLKEFSFAANSKFILDFLNSIENDTFILGLNEPNIPFILKEENFTTIVMPLNI